MPITGYNADAILEFYDKRPLEVGWRLNSLGLPLLGWYLGLLVDQLFGIQDGEAVQRKRGAELREHLVRTKSVALIKVRKRRVFALNMIVTHPSFILAHACSPGKPSVCDPI